MSFVILYITVAERSLKEKRIRTESGQLNWIKWLYIRKSEHESDLRGNEHYLSSSENEAWKSIQAWTGFKPMTSTISV